jgi:small subunit ribosomal protein S6
MTYEIKKKSEGIYAVIVFTATPDVAKELDRQLNLNEAVLRTKILRYQAPSAEPKQK